MADLAEIEIRVDSRQVKSANTELDRFAKTGGRVDKTVSKLNTSLGRARNTFGLLQFAIYSLGFGFAAKSVIGYTESYKGLQNQLRLVTDGHDELTMVTDRLKTVANESRSEFEGTATLYSRLFRSTRELETSQEDLFTITKAINSIFAASGATVIEASNAIRQLSQGIAAGALRGEEFNSVAEQAPDLLRAIGEAAGVAYGDLREFAAQGGITAELIVDATLKAAEAIEKRLNNTVLTLSQSLIVAKNNATEFFGESKNLASAIDSLGRVIITVSENLDELLTVAQLVAAVFAGRMVAGAIRYKDAVLAGIAATNAAAVAETNKLSLDLASAKASEALALAEVRRAAAANAAAAADLNAARAAQVATPGFVLNAQAMNALAAAEANATKASAAYTAATDALAVAQGRAIGTTNALSAATARATASTNAMTAASRGLQGAMALLGGPAGVVTILAATLFIYYKRMKDAETAAREAVRPQLELAVKIRDTKERIDSLNEAIGRYQDNIEELKRTGAPAQSIQVLEDQVRRYKDQVEQARNSLKTLQAQAAGGGGEDGEDGEAYEKAKASLDKLNQSLLQQVATFGMGEEAVLRYRLQFGDLSDEINALGGEGESYVNTLTNLAGIQEELKAKEEARLEALEAQKQAREDAERFTESLREQIESIKDQRTAIQLNGEELAVHNALVASSLKGKEDLSEADKNLKGQIEAQTRALYQEEEARKATDKAREESKRIIEGSRSTLDKYIDQLKLINRLESRGAEGGGLTAEQAMKARAKALEDYRNANEKATDDITKFWEKAAENMQDAMADTFFDFMQGELGNLEQSFKRMIDRMVAEALAAELGSKLFGKAAGGEAEGSGLIGSLANAASGFFEGGSQTGFGGGFAPQSGGFLSDLAGSVADFFSFDGGGYTGDSPRVGGIDGKGGFLAMMHPRETVVDHTKPQSTSNSVVVNINVAGVRDEGGLRKTSAQIAQAAGRASQRAIARNS